MEAVFPVAFVGLVVVTGTWIVVHVRAGGTRSIGPIGAILSTIVVAACTWPDAVAWAWHQPQLVLGLWLAALVLLVVELARLLGSKPAGGAVAALCNGLAVILSGGALLTLLSIATTSAGGV